MGKGTSTEADRAFDREVGRRIRQFRTVTGLTQGAVARSVGITFQQLQKYEHGTNRVAASRLGAIASALGIATAELLPAGNSTHDTGREPERDRMLASDELKLLASYRACAPNLRRLLNDLSEILAKPATA